MEDLAFKFNQRVQKQGKEWTNKYLQSAEKTIKENFSAKDQALKDLNQEIIAAYRTITGLNERLDNLEANQKIARRKELLQDGMLVLGALIASIGTGLLIWAFVSALYSFGFHSIWEWKAATPEKNASSVQQALAILLKSLLSIVFFLVGTAMMFAPLGIYHTFLKSIEHKRYGIKGWLNRVFLRK